MRHLTAILAVAAVALGAAHAALPTSLEDFQAQIAAKASDPKAAVGL
jgi:hypothetical protein